MISQDKENTIQRLLQLLQHLYSETGGLVESESDLQLWYNRGYANGMIQAFAELGYAQQVLDTLESDAVDRIAGQEFLPWGKAYRHGFEMGEKETKEVLDS